ncbi:pyridoxal phosphate-dependent aminotransferase [Aestuariivirga sp.]|uniref:pyridoxal phosphate-dependent aminotransferase n=1 Tax=Aestuariivirga sp. TaxID=2650926 RepID=UPI0025B86A63|nr:pyridoxal phosphate-dependent aminotransferase [Aestuariivirga sp.]MCA3556587.1 pyridoxal phosphate-dependent aminotransferase [Aestuariivirga sp.]
MTEFDPAALLVDRSRTADEGAIIRMSQRARELRARGADVISMTLGEPDFDTPGNIQSAATEAMRKGFTHYSPVMGIPELRAALSKKLKYENGLDYSESEIVLANGAKQAIANAMLSVIGAGDEVIMLAPFWVSYAITVHLAGGTPVVLHAGVEEGYKVSPDRIAAAITPRTKLIVLNSPSNPSGAVWSKAELDELAAVVRQHPRLMVMSDEIYEYIIFDGEMQSFGALPGMRERTITVNGFSKGFAMTGWRLGYAAAPEPIARAMARMQSAISAGANQFVQRAAIAALEGPRDEVQRMRGQYRLRRDMVQGGLNAIPGVRMGNIPATFYAFPDVSGLLGRKAGNHVLDTTDALCDWLLDEHHVATVPGTAFGAPGSIRLSFACGEAEIGKAVARMRKALEPLS